MNKLTAFRYYDSSADNGTIYYYDHSTQQYWSEKYQAWFKMWCKAFEKHVADGMYVVIQTMEKRGDEYYVS